MRPSEYGARPAKPHVGMPPSQQGPSINGQNGMTQLQPAANGIAAHLQAPGQNASPLPQPGGGRAPALSGLPRGSSGSAPSQQQPAQSGYRGASQQVPQAGPPFGGGPPTPVAAGSAATAAPRGPVGNGPSAGFGRGIGATQRPATGAPRPAQPPLQRPLGGGFGRPPMRPPASHPSGNGAPAGASAAHSSQPQQAAQQSAAAGLLSGAQPSSSSGGAFQPGGMQGLSAALPGQSPFLGSSPRSPMQGGSPPAPPQPFGNRGGPADGLPSGPPSGPPRDVQPRGPGSGFGGLQLPYRPPPTAPGASAPPASMQGSMQPPGVSAAMQPSGMPGGLQHPGMPNSMQRPGMAPPGRPPPGGPRPPSFGRPPPQFGRQQQPAQPTQPPQQQSMGGPPPGPPGSAHPAMPAFPVSGSGLPPASSAAQPSASPRGRAVPPGYMQLRNGPPAGVIRTGSSSRPGARIDPAQMPRPDAAPPQPEAQVFETRLASKHNIPPPSSHQIAVRDCGNASPRNMRLTLNCMPCSAALTRTSAMTLAAIIQPLALPGPEDDPLQVVDFGENGPVRCARCKAYINAFMAFVDGGRKFRCNICGHVNQTPEFYFSQLGPDGRRVDVYERPELCRGAVEFVATPEYMVQPPMLPTHLFLVDVSYAAISSGATAAACNVIQRTLDDLPGGDRARLGIATFDSAVQFYALRPGQTAPQMLVVPDTAEPYAPAAGSLLVNAREARALADQLLDAIPRLFEASQASEVATGAAIAASVAALKEGGGGKLHVFMAALPKAGAGALRFRRAEGGGGAEPLSIMAPEGKFYEKLATEAADHQVCIDLSVLGGGFVDVATLRGLCHHTSGQLYLYEGFDPRLDSDQLLNDLRWNLTRPQGLEAVARLRVSSGLEVDAYGGAFHRRTATDVDLPALNCDQALMATLVHDERLKDGDEAYLQFALLYTTTDGQRRIRLHNMGVPVTSVLGTVFRGADLEAQINVLARRAGGNLPSHSLTDTNKKVHQAVADTLFAYRRHCAAAANPGQLILPEALKLLPLYALALTKFPAFRPETPHDVRAAALQRLESLPAAATVPLLYGRLVPLHKTLAAALESSPSGDAPAAAAALDTAPLSSANVDAEGVYLLENGADAWLYFGANAPAPLVHDLLGLEAAQPMSPQAARMGRPLPRLESPASRALHAVLDAVRQQRSAYLRLRVVVAGDPLEAAFLANLVEDRAAGTGSYVEFLCDVHRQIQNKTSSG